MTKCEKVLLSLASCGRTNNYKCEGCLYIDRNDCAEKLANDAYDLIKSQNDELMVLRKENN